MIAVLLACSDIAVATYDGPPRTFASSFESADDFADFYSVPSGEWDSQHDYGALLFPFQQWVRLDVYIDLDADHGEAIAWQDGVRISAARVEGGNGALAQAHFGLYAAAAIPTGTIVNDDLSIREIADEPEALALLAAEIE